MTDRTPQHDSGKTTDSPETPYAGRHRQPETWSGGPVGNQDPDRRGLGRSDPQQDADR